MSRLERDEVEVNDTSRSQRQLNYMSDLDSAGIPLQGKAPVEVQRRDSMTDSEEFQDCEEELREFSDSGSSSELESSSSIYHSFANTEIPHPLEEDIDWERRAAFEANTIEVDQSEPSNSTEGNSSGCVSEPNSDPVSEMLVTLTSTHMGISAKRTTSPVPVRGAKLLETSIFDKVNLKSEALDTEEINRSLARNDDAPVYALPSLTVQERHVEERNAEMRTPRSRRTLHIQSQLPSYGMEPAPRGAVHRFSNGLARARSAPTEIKPILIPQEVMDADAEISEIISRHPGTPFSPIEERPDTSLSEPFQSMISTEYKTKQRSTTWIKRRLCFVSYDTESDAASITRSDVTGEIGRRDFNAGMNRARTSSSLRYAAGAVKGPRVSPVPRGGIRDFSKTEVFELNRQMSFEPQLAEIDMQEWTSKYIGFQSAADYYAHMVCDLSLHNINILALLKSRLGETHPLIGEIIEKLINGTSDLPSFVLGKEITHRPESRKNQRESGPKQARDSWHSKVETTLTNCGLNTTFFDRSLIGTKSEHEYFEYIAQRIINENFGISSEVLSLLMEQLGDDHPFITVLLQTIKLVENDFENKKLSIIDSDENISNSMKFTPEQEDSRTHSSQAEEASKEADEDSMMDSCTRGPSCSCFGGGLRRFMNLKFSKCLNSHRRCSTNKKSL